ncbi:MAG: hypothetical protein Q9170_008189 [Blastenia crenularia]
METTRIRGGTPTDYQVTYRITDPELLAGLDWMNRRSRQYLEQSTQEAIERARAEYQRHLPPEMLEPDTEDETLPDHNNLPSPPSTPPPSRPTPTYPVQSQNPASMQPSGLSSTPPMLRCHCCECSTRKIQPSSNPGSPIPTSLIDRVSPYEATSYQALPPSAITSVLAGHAELEEEYQTSGRLCDHLLSSQLPFSPATASPPHSKPNSPGRRNRQSQPSSGTTRPNTAATALLSGLTQLPQQDIKSNSVKKATASMASGGSRRPSRAATVSSTQPRTHAGVKKARSKRNGKDKKSGE